MIYRSNLFVIDDEEGVDYYGCETIVDAKRRIGLIGDRDVVTPSGERTNFFDTPDGALYKV